MTEFNVGPYRVVERLGEGGMGTVYLAMDDRLQRRVAVKCVSAPRLHQPESRHRLLREARAAASLNHPNVAAVYDVVEADDQLYVVMEYVEGETLDSLVRRGPLPLGEAVFIGLQVANGVGAAHAAGIVHRDLKPSNIVRTKDGNVKVLDFGLAKIAPPPEGPEGQTPEDRITKSGAVVGTPAYMAPEQRELGVADERSDIYSLGLVLLELCVGLLPLGKADALSSRGGPEIGPFPTTMPRALRRVLRRATARAPDERYQTMNELTAHLRRFGESSGLTTREMPRPAQAIGRKALVYALVLVSLVWLVIYVRGQLTRPDELPPVVAVLPLANLSSDPSLDLLAVGIANTLISNFSAIRNLTTISRSATVGYGGENDTSRIAQELGATLLVTGTLQKATDRYQVSVNLVRADDSIAWGGVYESSVHDVFGLQRRLSRGLSDALRLNLTEVEVDRLESPPTDSRDAYANYVQGRAFLERPDVAGNLERAETLLLAAIDEDPGFALAHAALGEVYWAQYRSTRDLAWTEKARLATEEARRLDPTHPSVRLSLAIVYDGTGRTEDAIAELRRATELQPNLDEAHRLLGVILAREGSLDEGLESFDKAIQARPSYTGHYRSLGRAYYNAGRMEEAITTFRRVTELQPDLPWGFQMLGASHHARGELDEAIANYEKAIELGRSPASFSNLGTIFYRRGEFQKAVNAYQEAIRLRPSSAATHRNLGDAYERLGEEEKAREAYLRAVELETLRLRVNPQDARSMARLAVYEAKLGRATEAARDADAAVELSPSDAQVVYRRAVVYALLGDADTAAASLEDALALGYSTSEAMKDDDLVSLRDHPNFVSLTK